MPEEINILPPHMEATKLALGVPPPDGALTPDQLEARHQLVALHRAVEQRPPDLEGMDFMRQLSAMSVAEAQATIQAERAKGYPTPQIRSYNAYLTDLKAVRAEQREHLTTALHEAAAEPLPDVRRALFLKALDHSPVLAQRTLEKVNTTASNEFTLIPLSGKRLFSDEQIVEAAADKDRFQQALIQSTIREPGIVLAEHSVMSAVADRPTIRAALDAVFEADPDGLSHNLEAALDYYSVDEQRDLLTAMADRQPTQMLHHVMNKKWSEVVGDQFVRATAQAAVEKGDYLPTDSQLQKCIDAGYVTKAAVKASLGRRLAANPADTDARLLNSDLFSDTDRDELHQLLLQQIATLEGEKLLSTVDKSSVLSDDEKRVIFQEEFARDPIAVIKSNPFSAQPYIETSSLRKELLNYIAADPESAYGNAYLFLANDALTAEDKVAFARDLAAHDPYRFMNNLDEIAGDVANPFMDESMPKTPSLLEPEELRRLTLEVLDSLSFPDVALGLHHFIGLVGDEAAQRDFITQGMAEEPALNIFTNSNKPVLDALFNKQDQFDMLQVALDSVIADPENYVDQFTLQYIGDLFGEGVMRNAVNWICVVDAKNYLNIIDSMAYLFDKQEIETELTRIAADDANLSRMLESIAMGWSQTWTNVVDPEFAASVIRSAGAKHLETVAFIGERLQNYWSTEETQAFWDNLAVVNPPLAIHQREAFGGIVSVASEAELLEAALNDEPRMAVMGKYLRDSFNQLRKTDKVGTRQQILRETSDMYTTLARQIKKGNLPSLRELHDRMQLNPTTERNAVEVYDLIDRLGNADDKSRLEEAASLAEVNVLVAASISRTLGITAEVSDEAANRLIERLQRMAPLGLYADQYYQSPAHVAVLKPMVESLLAGQFDEWKYGARGPENLAAMQENNWLPEGLTIEQYDAWRLDDQSQQRESLSVGTEAVVGEFRRILSDEALRLPEGSLVPAAKRDGAVAEAAKDLVEVGQSIGTLQRERKILNEQPYSDMTANQLADIERQLSDLQVERRDLQVQQAVIQLTNLTEEELQSGAVGASNGSKGRPILQILQRLQKDLQGSDLALLGQQLDNVYDSYRSQTDALQDIAVTDTGNPKITIEIGDVPLPSCQNYRNGSHNRALLGYTDPNTKILLASNERGRPIARSVLRLLSDDAGQPVLHVETVYASDLSDGVLRAVYRHAINKGQTMDLPVYISMVSQNDEGRATGIRNVEGIETVPVEGELQSSGSRAPLVYVDSNGGIAELGRYHFGGTARLQSAPAATP